MALSDDEKAIFDRLSSLLGKRPAHVKRRDAYYDGERRLEQLGLAVPPELERFTTLVAWPRISVDSLEQRLNVDGFRLPGTDEADDELYGIWQANGLDEESQVGHLEALLQDRAYVAVGTRAEDEPDPGMPLVTVESSDEVAHELDPRTRRVRAAVRRVRDTASIVRGAVEYGTLYLPGVTVWQERVGGSGWVEIDRNEHGLGVVPVVPLVNRPRLRRRQGTSEMGDVISLTDAACRALTNAQVATEVMAIPQRYVVGAQPKDFVDEAGQPVTQWETYFGAVWALANKDASVGQFTAAQLSNFTGIVNHYAQQCAAASGLPARFFGQVTTNPPSEGSIVADEVRLIMTARRKQRVFGGPWEWAMRLCRRVVDGDWDPRLARMETMWASPETPTEAQTADAVLKLLQAKDARGVPVLPLEMAREQLGWSKTKRDRARLMDDEVLDAELAAARSLAEPVDAGLVDAAAGGR